MGKSSVDVKFVGDHECTVEQIDGTQQSVLIKDIHVAPDAGCNLLSLAKLLKQGDKLCGDDNSLKATRGKFFPLLLTKLWKPEVDSCLVCNFCPSLLMESLLLL